MNLKVERNIPFPKKTASELVNFILNLNDGDSIYLKYDEFNKTIITNCLANVRVRIAAKGLMIKSLGDNDGRRVWVFARK